MPGCFGCHCGRVRFRARVDLDLLSQCSCSICTKKGILHLPIAVEDFQLLGGKNALTVYTFGTGVARRMNAAYSRLGLVRDARSKLNPMTRQRDSEATWVLIVASEYFEHYQFVDALSEESMLLTSFDRRPLDGRVHWSFT